MAILKYQLLNKLAPWWPKRKNKATFIIKIPPIYINKVALFSSFDPFKGPKQPFQGSSCKINSAPWWSNQKTKTLIPAEFFKGHLSQISCHFVNFEANLLKKNPNGGYPSAKLHRKREGPRFARALMNETP